MLFLVCLAFLDKILVLLLNFSQQHFVSFELILQNCNIVLQALLLSFLIPIVLV